MAGNDFTFAMIRVNLSGFNALISLSKPHQLFVLHVHPQRWWIWFMDSTEQISAGWLQNLRKIDGFWVQRFWVLGSRVQGSKVLGSGFNNRFRVSPLRHAINVTTEGRQVSGVRNTQVSGVSVSGVSKQITENRGQISYCGPLDFGLILLRNGFLFLLKKN